MKAKSDVVLSFMLALAPVYAQIHSEACSRWSRDVVNCTSGEISKTEPTEAESLLDLAEMFAEQYYEEFA